MDQKPWAHAILIIGQDVDLFPQNSNKIIIESETSIGIEKIRNLKSSLSLKTTNNQPLIAIIKQAEKLTEEAQNALLKTLEEPPENVKIILSVKTPETLLSTIISRCQIIELPPVANSDLSPEEISKLTAILDLIGESDIAQGFTWAKESSPDRPSAIKIIDKLLFVAHQQLLQDQVLQKASEQARIIAIATKLFAAKRYLVANTNTRLTLENLFLN